jgi:4-hydroxy-tetrahydrodipicolinate reductase
MKRVVIQGILGNMGTEVMKAVSSASDLNLVGAVDLSNSTSVKFHEKEIPLFNNVNECIKNTSPDILVDFSASKPLMSAASICLPNKISIVSGTTGVSEEDLVKIKSLSDEHQTGVIYASNFAIGAVLMIHIAKLVSTFFDNAEINEAHHENKIDAPSGTSISIARAIISGRKSNEPLVSSITETEVIKGSRGADYEGVKIHASRMPGMLAQHNLIFGTSGQTLEIKHNTINRDCYMPGVIRAIRDVQNHKTLIIGLENILGL